MIVISYNLNGIRSAMSKGLPDWLSSVRPDVFCVQETKASPDQVESSLFEALGYKCYYHSAEKKGYSGVAIFSLQKPDYISTGIKNPKFDNEGRVLRADFGDVTVISVYVPSGTTGDVRQDFKMEFLEAFNSYITDLRETRPNVIISGDFNICHKPEDINHPERQKGVSGFLPEEREWVTQFIGQGFIDSFREFNKQPNQYSWWSYRAQSRMKNLGWRIDYNFVSESLRSRLVNATILQQVVHSDHCPVCVEIK